MAVLAEIDIVETLEMRESNGQVTYLKRLARVTGLTNTDFTVLMASLEAAGIPPKFEALTEPGFEHLVLQERNPKIAFNDPSICDVELVYQPAIGVQDLTTIGQNRGLIYGKARTSMKQVSTNFYRDNNGVGPIRQIIVEHTFPADDPDYPNITVRQGGEVTVYQPESNFMFEGYMDTFNPWGIKKALSGGINIGVWLNHPAREWMATDIQFEMVSVGRYHFVFEFQHNPDGWNPTAVFNDERTGRPPPDLVANVGYKVIPYHKLMNFNIYFGAFFEDWQQVF